MARTLVCEKRVVIIPTECCRSLISNLCVCTRHVCFIAWILLNELLFLKPFSYVKPWLNLRTLPGPPSPTRGGASYSPQRGRRHPQCVCPTPEGRAPSTRPWAAVTFRVQVRGSSTLQGPSRLTGAPSASASAGQRAWGALKESGCSCAVALGRSAHAQSPLPFFWVCRCLQGSHLTLLVSCALRSFRPYRPLKGLDTWSSPGP